jgi:hypothetical protein
MASTRVWILAAVLACVLLVRSADAAAAAAPAPAATRSSVLGCNPQTDKTCNVMSSGGGIDLDGDGQEDELPSFSTHLTILGHDH